MTTIFKMLDVSMWNIPFETDQALGTIGLTDTIVGAWHDNGYVVSVPEANDPVLTTISLQGHGALARILGFAQKLGCHYVKLDADAEVLDGFETYDW